MKASILSLNTLFEEPVSYRIPQFQRPYAWTKDEQWAPLWDDVREVAGRILASGENIGLPHFMGAIVLKPSAPQTGKVKTSIVVDGQQRLTTLQLLIKATEGALQGRNLHDDANCLVKLTTNKRDSWIEGADDQTKIRQSNIHDQESFQLTIRNQPSDSKASRKIYQAYKFFGDEVSLWLDNEPNNRRARAKALVEVLTNKLQLAAIDLDEDEKPHRIFEVLNTRGEPLKQSDLVKNTVLYEANVVEDADRARELWGTFDSSEWWRTQTNEGRTLQRIHLDRFLHYWLITKLAKDVVAGRSFDITADRVSKAFNSYVARSKGDLEIEAIAKDMQDAGVVYRDLETVQQPGIEPFLRRIKTMGVGTVFPPLLWIFTHTIPNDQIMRAIKALESYLIRRMLCNINTQGLNRVFVELLPKMETQINNVDQAVIDFLKGQTAENRIWPNDYMLTDVLTTRPLRVPGERRKMVLEAIESNQTSNMTEPIDAKTLTLEHIMPKEWAKNWPMDYSGIDKEESEELRKQSIEKIGNLTLVTGRLNASLSNAPWHEKRQALGKHSVLRLNKKLLDKYFDTWDESTIDERSKYLALIVSEIWPFADDI